MRKIDRLCVTPPLEDDANEEVVSRPIFMDGRDNVVDVLWCGVIVGEGSCR